MHIEVVMISIEQLMTCVSRILTKYERSHDVIANAEQKMQMTATRKRVSVFHSKFAAYSKTRHQKRMCDVMSCGVNDDKRRCTLLIEIKPSAIITANREAFDGAPRAHYYTELSLKLASRLLKTAENYTTYGPMT